MKILIWNKNIELRDTGGPFGYLFKLHKYLDSRSSDEIAFYSDVVNHDINDSHIEQQIKGGFKQKLKNNSFIMFLYEIWKGYFSRLSLSNSEKELLKGYTAVHVHTAVEALQYSDAFHQEGKKVILTTHTPEPFTTEFFNHGNNNGKYAWMLKYIPFLKRFLIKRELLAYDKVDVIMFPVPQAREAYTSVSKPFVNKFKEVDSKFVYVPTAINKDVSFNNEHRLDSVIKSEKCLRACYVGRHNEIKGYDTVKQIAQRSWASNIDVEFVIGGKEGPIYGLDDERWHELGWVSTGNLLEEVDVFILPNRQTYYDLILLEVLRSGTPVLLTRTGGNKWFEQFVNDGALFFYDYGDVETASRCIRELLEFKNRGKLEELRIKNKSLFLKTSIIDLYVENYLVEMRKVLE